MLRIAVCRDVDLELGNQPYMQHWASWPTRRKWERGCQVEMEILMVDAKTKNLVGGRSLRRDFQQTAQSRVEMVSGGIGGIRRNFM